MWKEGWSDVGCCWELGDDFSAMTVIGEGSRVWKHHWAPGRSHSGSPNVKQQKNALAPWASSCGKAGPPVIIARGPQRPCSEGRVSGNSRLQNYGSSARGKSTPDALTASQGHLFSDQKSVCLCPFISRLKAVLSAKVIPLPLLLFKSELLFESDVV